MKTYQIDGCTVQVNTQDYASGVVVESVRAQNVPAWDEMGFPELAGPFASREEAEKICAELERFYSREDIREKVEAEGNRGDWLDRCGW
jgi:hypothetical protein